MTTYTFLEMLDAADFADRPSADPDFQVREARIKQWQVNRLLYQAVGENWYWLDKLTWTEQQWRDYAEADNLRTFTATVKESLAGYYELRQGDDAAVEIAYFGLMPRFIGQGYGGPLLSDAIRNAWDWQAERVWVYTCSHDHPNALNNYQRCGLSVFKTERKAWP